MDNNIKKIFITIPWFSPAFRAGGPVKSIVNLIKNYRENVEYYIFCGDRDLNNFPLEVQKNTWVSYNTYTKVWYSPKDNRSQTLLDQVNKVKPDILFVVGIYSWHFSVVPLMFCKGPKKIISPRGMLHPGALGQKKLKKKIYLTAWKSFGVQHKGSFHATDETEKDFISDYFQEDLDVTVAANFPGLFEPSEIPPKEKGNITLITIALISAMKNHLVILESLKLCKASVMYHIYGPVKDEHYWNECKDLIVQLPQNIKVQYHGEALPSEISEVLSAAHVFILPSKSENYGHALIEAMSAARPVITSNFTPWNNLIDNRAGLNVNISPTAISEAIDKFADMDQAELQIWSKATSEYARDAVNMKFISDQYDTLFDLKDKAQKH